MSGKLKKPQGPKPLLTFSSLLLPSSQGVKRYGLAVIIHSNVSSTGHPSPTSAGLSAPTWCSSGIL